jgi:colanic acid biosynthesis glycosyl transferase WcaI
MRFGLLTQWYDPEPGPAALPGVLARGLQAAGHEVQVLTGFPNYPTGVLAGGYRLRPKLDERLGNVDVRRVALYPNHDESAVRRAANYASFGLSAMAFGIDALRGLDALWVNYSPITVAWPMWAARYGLRIPSVVHVLDLWPDTVLAGGVARNRTLFRAVSAPLNAWCKGMYAAASSVAYISPSVGEVLRRRGVADHKLHHVPMWTDEDLFRMSAEDLREPLGIDEDRIVLLYAGALGEAQGLSTMLAACARVEDPRFLALIAGSGIAEGSLRDQAERMGLRNVLFLGRLPQDQMTKLMATADLSYIGLRPHPLSDMTMPSKTQAALAAGRALVVAATGDVVRTAQESRAALVADPGDVAGIADVFARACALGRAGLAEMGARGRAYYERTFAAQRGVDAVEALLLKAAGERVAA